MELKLPPEATKHNGAAVNTSLNQIQPTLSRFLVSSSFLGILVKAQDFGFGASRFRVDP